MADPYARFERLKFDRPHPGVLRIRLSSPLKLGAMDALMHKEVAAIWDVVEADESVAAVLLTGEGRNFSAGGDLNHERKACDDHDLRMATMNEARRIVYGMLDCTKPIVSAARGWAVGAGLACLIMADVSIVSRDAKFSDGHLKIGIAAGDHAAIIWPLLCGMAKAKYYLLTAETFTGEEAERMNLVSMALDDAEVEDRALEIAARLADGPRNAIGWTKQALNGWMRQAAPIFEQSHAMEMIGIGGPEGREGISAFLEKRKPDFGRTRG